MLTPVTILVALALASDAPAASADPPTVVLPSAYGDTVAGVLATRGVEWAAGAPRERAWAAKLVVDSYLRDLPLALRVDAELGNDVLAEIGAKALLPALGPLRAYAAVCAGGALRSGVGLGSASAAAGIDVRTGPRVVLTVEVEARYRWDPEQAQTDRTQTAALAGVAVVF